MVQPLPRQPHARSWPSASSSRRTYSPRPCPRGEPPRGESTHQSRTYFAHRSLVIHWQSKKPCSLRSTRFGQQPGWINKQSPQGPRSPAGKPASEDAGGEVPSLPEWIGKKNPNFSLAAKLLPKKYRKSRNLESTLLRCSN